jgi:hypothetical protein
VYSLGLNNAPRFSFTHVKSRDYNIRRFKQGTSHCKMAGTGFQSGAKLRLKIFNPVLADRSVNSADCHNKIGHTADCQSQESGFESGMPQA